MSETEGEYWARMAREIEEIRQENFKRIARAHKTIMIVDIDGHFEVHSHTPDGIGPPSSYLTKQKAAARVLQLLGVGPVAPQTWPEEVCVGSVSTEPEEVA
jgi:translation initiation factor 2 alpha subunit (eIF-2alpha)